MNKEIGVNYELKKAEAEYENYLEKYENTELFSLTQDNIIKVETMLLYNPRYSNFKKNKEMNDKDEKKITDIDTINNKLEICSSKYLIGLIKHGLDNKLIFDRCLKDEKNLIFYIFKKINHENSTRASTSDIEKMSSLITAKCNSKIEKLIDILRNTEEGAELIGNLTVTDKCKKNFSLATKFCHYMCINYFDGSERDNYSIYDNVVANNIPKYFEYYKENILKGISLENYLKNLFKNAAIENELSEIIFLTNDDEKKLNIDKYKIKDKDKAEIYTKFYKIYQKLIDDIIDVASEKHKQRISRNGFDHILWYTNK